MKDFDAIEFWVGAGLFVWVLLYLLNKYGVI